MLTLWVTVSEVTGSSLLSEVMVSRGEIINVARREQHMG